MGFIIVVEGLDGSGKTTQLRRLESYIRDRAHLELITSKSLPASPLRSVMTEGVVENPRHLVLLYRIALDLHIEEVEELARTYDVVLCDRSILSWHAYQGYGFEQQAMVDELETNGWFQPSYVPDVLCYLDIPYAVMLERILGSRDAFDYIEQRGEAFFERVRTGFDRLIVTEGQNSDRRFWPQTHCCRIPAHHSEDHVFTQLVNQLSPLLSEKGIPADT